MANRRNLKRDVRYLTSEIIEECYTFNVLFPKIDSEKVAVIINDALTMHNDLIFKINNPEVENDKKSLKPYFKGVFNELIKSTDSLFDRLNKLAPAQ